MTLPRVSPQEAATELLRRRKARRGLIDFIRYTKPEYQVAPHHERIANALEAVERGDCPRLIIEAPPRHGKSELASRRFPAWAVGRKPDRQVVTASYNIEFASDIGRDVRHIVDDRDFRNIFPNVSLRKDSQAATRWHTNDDGIYVATGVEGALTGRGADLAIVDDPFKDRAEADSETRRNAVWKWYTNVFLTRLMPNAAVVVMNTRWHEDDLTGRILEAAKRTGEHWERLSFPAIRPDGSSLWPERYPPETLAILRGTMDVRDWLALYQQSPTAEEGTYFKRENFRRYKQVPERLNVYTSADYAVTDGAGDFTEIAAWGVDTLDNVYVLDWWYGQTASDEWVEQTLNRWDRFRPLYHASEAGVIRRAVEPWLERRARERKTFCAVQWLPSTGDKTAMARSFQALCGAGRVYWPETEWAERAIDQLLRFPAGKHDDVVDCCGVFGRLIDRIWAATKPPAKPPELAEVWNQPLTMGDVMKPVRAPEW